MELRREEVVSSTPCLYAELVALLPPPPVTDIGPGMLAPPSYMTSARGDLLHNKSQGGLLANPCHVSYSDTPFGGQDPSTPPSQTIVESLSYPQPQYKEVTTTMLEEAVSATTSRTLPARACKQLGLTKPTLSSVGAGVACLHKLPSTTRKPLSSPATLRL
jgi:hypothetical protein